MFTAEIAETTAVVHHGKMNRTKRDYSMLAKGTKVEDNFFWSILSRSFTFSN